MLLHKELLPAGPVLLVSQTASTHHVTSGLNSPCHHHCWPTLSDMPLGNQEHHPPPSGNINRSSKSLIPPWKPLPNWPPLGLFLPTPAMWLCSGILHCLLPGLLSPSFPPPHHASYRPQQPPSWIMPVLVFCSQTDLDLSSCATSICLTLDKLLTFWASWRQWVNSLDSVLMLTKWPANYNLTSC